MSDETDSKTALLRRIEGKRGEIAAFLAQAQPRNKRLVNSAIFGSAIGVALTAGPALGGKAALPG
ncbi:MAG: hypothetical protein GKR89_04775 [Candidatus Latescibacteria bacterium]|nr:hypothetical protein [Candidatus Latescibacterota bacterium]